MYHVFVTLSCRAAQQEIAALSQMAEQLNSKLAVTEQAGDSVDLDNLFAFLSEVQPNRNQIIDEIGERMNELVEDLDVEVCRWIITCQYGKVLLYLQLIYKLLLI
jgi:hypothetical protein